MFKALIFIAVLTAGLTLAGCQSTGQPLVIDTGDFERVRFEIEQLRSEYATLQQSYRELTESNRFYAEFYRSTTEAIGRGLGELHTIGTDSQSEIARLRELVGILRSIVSIIIDADADIGTGER